MFNEFSVLSTAISSFNNSALVAPFFFLAGILSLPLLFMVYLYGRDFVSKIGWGEKNLESQIGFAVSGILLLWTVLFGGNYMVIRDGISLLPVVLSVVLFGLTILFIQTSKQLNYIEKIRHYKYRWLVLFAVLFCAGYSAMPNWYSILLNIASVFCGIVLGSRIRKNISVIPYSVIVSSVLLIAVLMQPEFFRFGQLGNLTIIHVLAMIITGFFATTCLVTKYTNARQKIHESAYIKLKWLFRIMSLLALVLFFMTESVPVFIGLMIATAMSEMLYIYHSNGVKKDLYKQSFAWFLICFGTILVCPVVSAIGIVYLTFLSNFAKAKDFTDLL